MNPEGYGSAPSIELAHDAFLRLLSKPASQGLKSFPEARGYLRAMANGLCADFWRRREVEQAWLDTLASRPEAFEPSPEQRAIIIETLMEIGSMLAKLPPAASCISTPTASCKARLTICVVIGAA